LSKVFLTNHHSRSRSFFYFVRYPDSQSYKHISTLFSSCELSREHSTTERVAAFRVVQWKRYICTRELPTKRLLAAEGEFSTLASLRFVQIRNIRRVVLSRRVWNPIKNVFIGDSKTWNTVNRVVRNTFFFTFTPTETGKPYPARRVATNSLWKIRKTLDTRKSTFVWRRRNVRTVTARGRWRGASATLTVIQSCLSSSWIEKTETANVFAAISSQIAWPEIMLYVLMNRTRAGETELSLILIKEIKRQIRKKKL